MSVCVALVERMLLEVSRATPPARGHLAHDESALVPYGRCNLDGVLGLIVSLSNRQRYIPVGVGLAKHVIGP
eukprot:3480193-Prymnesium_polylepis.1